MVLISPWCEWNSNICKLKSCLFKSIHIILLIISSYSFQDFLSLALWRLHSKMFVFYCGNLKSRNIQKNSDTRCMHEYVFFSSLKTLSTQVESAIFVLYSTLKIYCPPSPLLALSLLCFRVSPTVTNCRKAAG